MSSMYSAEKVFDLVILLDAIFFWDFDLGIWEFGGIDYFLLLSRCYLSCELIDCLYVILSIYWRSILLVLDIDMDMDGWMNG